MTLPTGRVINADCLEVLRGLPDQSVDLILTDPPYGIGAGREKPHNGWKDYGISDWDMKRPEKELFDEMRRVSKNQIIWGGNYFADYLPPSMGWLVWDKCQREFSLADGELAWTSFHRATRIFSYPRGTALRDGKEHPTQKPLDLMAWCLRTTAVSEGAVVFDPYLGSGTTALACEKMGIRWMGCEVNQDYAAIASRRIEAERAQGKLF